LSYQLKWHEKAIDDLKSIDKKNAKSLIERLKTYLPQDPISIGKPLKGTFKGLHRYRFRDDRVIYSIDRKENTILILRIGKRKAIYNQDL